MDTEFINLCIGLIILITSNVLLGSVTSLFQKQFDKVKFIQGVIKSSIILTVFIGVTYAGVLNPNILMIEINGQSTDLLTAIKMLVMGSYLWYGKDVFVKLSNLISGKVKIGKDEETK